MDINSASKYLVDFSIVTDLVQLLRLGNDKRFERPTRIINLLLSGGDRIRRLEVSNWSSPSSKIFALGIK